MNALALTTKPGVIGLQRGFPRGPLVGCGKAFLEMKESNEVTCPLVAVGGIGGSGTRLVARLFMLAGVHMGTDINESLDNLAFTLLFKRRELLGANSTEFEKSCSLLVKAMTDSGPISPEEADWLRAIAGQSRPQHTAAWLELRARSIIECGHNPSGSGKGWGWKEPNTNLFAESLIDHFEGLKYIHVIRHGCDMALSHNQNQMETWGKLLLGHDQQRPADSLNFWIVANRRIREMQSRHPSSVIFVKFEDLCRQPEDVASRLLDFCGVHICSTRLEKFMNIVSAPPTIGRYRGASRDVFMREDLAALEEFGYEY